MKSVLATAALTLLFCTAAVSQGPQQVHQGLGPGGPRDIIANVLESAHASASLEYNGRCGPDILFPDLPPVLAPKKPYSQNPAGTLRSMFSIDRGTAVSQQSNGIIRIVGAGVPTDILEVRIHHLSFHAISSAGHALHVVLSAPEVQSFLQLNRIGQPGRTCCGGLDVWDLENLPGLNTTPSPRPGVPSISGELGEVTLADALDYIIKTFPGFWLYQNCEDFRGQRVVYFGMFPVPGVMWLWDGSTEVY